MSSPTQRALKDLRALGFQAQVVEKYNAFARIRIDLFGCIDIVAVREGVGILGVQACAAASHAARMTKAKAEPKLRLWLAAGARFEVWSYGLKGAKGKRKKYTLRREELTREPYTMLTNTADWTDEERKQGWATRSVTVSVPSPSPAP